MQKLTQSGFTLVELLITIGVGAILLGFAVPSFLTVIHNGRMTASVNELVASLQLARSEAVKRRAPITMCRSDNATDANPDCAQGTGWEDGWLVFVDDNDADGDGIPDGNGAFDAGEAVIRTSEGFPANTVTVAVLAAAAPLDDSITYLASGFPRTGGLAAGRNMLFCDGRDKNDFGRVVNISQTGRPQVRRVADVANLGMSCE